MPAEFIPPMAAIAEPTFSLAVERAVPASSGTAFSSAVTQGLSQVDQQLKGSQLELQRLAAGEVGSLHQVMVRLEESRLSMQFVLQVRNRLLESYQELMRMQV